MAGTGESGEAEHQLLEEPGVQPSDKETANWASKSKVPIALGSQSSDEESEPSAVGARIAENAAVPSAMEEQPWRNLLGAEEAPVTAGKKTLPKKKTAKGRKSQKTKDAEDAGAVSNLRFSNDSTASDHVAAVTGDGKAGKEQEAPLVPDINYTLLELFQLQPVPKTEDLLQILDLRADPNYRINQPFKLNGITFEAACPLMLGVLTRDIDLVHHMIEAKADINNSDYTKTAGASMAKWTGNSAFGALILDCVDMLTYLVESCGVLPNLQSTLDGAPAATLLWNAAYLGSIKCMTYLLEQRAEIDKPAPSQDKKILMLTPLHAAAKSGQVACCEVLLKYKADIHGKCKIHLNEDNAARMRGHWYFTPLDDAIELGQIAVVKLLLRSKAELIRLKSEESNYLMCSGESLRIDRSDYTLQALFSSGNGRCVYETALALQESAEQVKRLRLEDIIRFLGTPGRAPAALMKALFFQRESIRYWKSPELMFGKKTGTEVSGKLQLLTESAKHGNYNHFFYRQDFILGSEEMPKRMWTQAALITKIIVYGKSQFVINMTTGPSTDDVKKHWDDKTHLAYAVPDFIARVAPQPGQAKSWPWISWFTSLLRAQVYLPVDFYVCLIPNLHRSEEVLKAIASCSDQDVFTMKECEAIVSYNWEDVRKMYLFDMLSHLLICLLVLLAVSTMRVNVTEHGEEWCAQLSSIAYVAMPCIALKIISRCGQVRGFLKGREFKAWELQHVALEF
eukprot:TRINITY_DN21508_c0_g1_i1.p1 TRINITY_DN21508_c0_g1~~TRINITY_DN21508_c0_g1_i1.p1  ORF type:complete len:738 (+),score=137.17 TRINITY_DN21508_c0_g1_i1:130-2343(+)